MVKRSSYYLTPPWGKTDQPYFLNQALQVSGNETPDGLLQVCLKTEKHLGRIRKEKYGQRTIDIDILYFEDQVINVPGLVIPHPRLYLRRFALAPMAEIAPEFIHPVLRKSQGLLLEECPDHLPVRKLCFD